jgi:hypothetical protein
MTNNDVYNAIKAQEANFPIPKPKATLVAGTFDAHNGTFKYAGGTYKKTVIDQPDPKTHDGPLKPQQEVLIGGKVDAVNVFDLSLKFDVTGRQGDFYLKIPGKPIVHAPAGQNSITVDVGSINTLNFTIGCNGHEFTPDLPLKINRPIVGAGAMTIRALPVTLIYAPPMDQQKRNKSAWAASESAGSTTVVSFGQGNSQTKPAMSQFQSWADMAGGMKAVSEVLSKVPNPYVQAAGAALGVISGLLGSTSATETKGTTVTNQKTLTITNSSQTSISTDPTSGGPGKGDVLYLLKNAKLCWYADGGPLKLALLGWDEDVIVSVSYLQSHGAQMGFDTATIQALLNLDPFVANGPTAMLPASRYVHLATYDINANNTAYDVTYSLTSADMQQTVNTTINTEVDNASPLAFLGIGVPETQTIQSTLTQSSATTSTSTHSIVKHLQFFGGPEEFYGVEVYADVIFGTLAFRPVAAAPQIRLGGILTDLNGKLLANTKVSVVSNGKHFTTTTDDKGAFAFRASTLQPGTVEISSGATKQAVNFTGTPVTGLKLASAPLEGVTI